MHNDLISVFAYWERSEQFGAILMDYPQNPSISAHNVAIQNVAD